jgi:hypothetical protein
MKRRGPYTILLSIVAVLFVIHIPEPTAAQSIGAQPGAFSRMGFGARGIGMGNAMVSNTQGDVVGYYNPALLPWIQSRSAAATMGVLALDRRLNFLHVSLPLPPNAGISAGVINSGVSEIDGRDSDGRPTGPLRTSENQFFLGFSLRFKPGFSLGINLKLYYYQLYTDISSTTVGLDIGALYEVSESLTIGGAIRDLNSKYKWDTSSLYGQSGQTSEDLFPRLYLLGATYRLPGQLGVLSAEVEFSSVKTVVLRTGVEVPLVPELTLRGGLDRIDLKDEGNGIKPSLGFSAQKSLGEWTPAVQYTYVIEPFSTSGIHLIAISATF